MRWECRECGRVHDHDPGVCVCGSADQRQQPPPDDPGPLERARLALLDSRERPLLADGPLVRLAFRVVVAVSLVVFLLVVWAMVL